MKKKICVLVLLLLIFLIGCSSPAPQYPTRGVWEGNIYTNEYIGVRLTLPERWTVATEAEIAMLHWVSPDTFPAPGATIPDEAWDGAHFYDMIAQDDYTGSSIIIMYERLLDEAIDTSEREYLELMRDMMGDEMPEHLTILTAYDTVGIGATHWYALTVMMDEVQQYYFVNILDGYVRSILITVAGGDTLEDILGMFE